MVNDKANSNKMKQFSEPVKLKTHVTSMSLIQFHIKANSSYNPYIFNIIFQALQTQTGTYILFFNKTQVQICYILIQNKHIL